MPGRDDRTFDPRLETREEGIGAPGSRGDGPRAPESRHRALALVDRALALCDSENTRLVNYLLLLRHQLEADETQLEEAQKLLAEYEEAYQKLTSPANRVGTYLGPTGEGFHSVATGDGEFVCTLDPRLEDSTFQIGTRVRLNEAYAVVGDLGPWPHGPLAKVAEVLGHRLRVAVDATGQSSRIVLQGSVLGEAPLKAGDEVRVEPSYHVALEHFPAQETRDFYLEEIPELPWEKVGGQDEAIRTIREAIELPLLHPEIYARFGKRPMKGILLYGPPGCGKTLIGKATAYNLTRAYSEKAGKDVREYFMLINGPKILNMWLGESERMVREIFARAREKAADGRLVFIFIDEAESLLRTRSSGRYLNISNTIVPQFAAEMDGLVSLQNVVVILTSNRPDYIDPAVLRPERIDRRVKVGRPDESAARSILGIYLHSGVPIDPELVSGSGGDAEAARSALVEDSLAYLFRRCPDTEFLEVHLHSGTVERLYWSDMLSGALLASVVERAKDAAIRRAIQEESEDQGLTQEDLRAAIRAEYSESEIFPRSDVLEDWLKLIDRDPERVAAIHPIRPENTRRNQALRRGIL